VRVRLTVPLAVLALVGGAVVAGSAASAAPKRMKANFAPAATATVYPGVQTRTQGGQCTSNFVFTDGTSTYIGQAAHCSGAGEATETNGCDAKSLPEGTEVKVTGASRPGVMVYNSWIRMQKVGETNPAACDYNDFALIRLDPADVPKTNPSVRVFGGPTGLRSTGTTFGEKVVSYGTSSLRFSLPPTSPKYGRSLGTTGAGWSHVVYTATPGIPGDSGSGFLDGTGKAFGTLSTVAIYPPASNGVGDLARELAYAQSHGFAGLSLVKGTEPFTPDLAGAVLSGGIGG